jgi:uncharacterized protein YdeI (YjbR/CyaY-like superfamily)
MLHMDRCQGPPEVTLPDDLRRALGRSRDAGAAWDSFPYSHRKRYVDWIEEAKRPETRSRRITKAIEMMAAKKPRR